MGLLFSAFTQLAVAFHYKLKQGALLIWKEQTHKRALIDRKGPTWLRGEIEGADGRSLTFVRDDSWVVRDDSWVVRDDREFRHPDTEPLLSSRQSAAMRDLNTSHMHPKRQWMNRQH